MLEPMLATKVVSPELITGTRSSAAAMEASQKRFPTIRMTTDNLEAVHDADVVVWGTKPQDFRDGERCFPVPTSFFFPLLQLSVSCLCSGKSSFLA